MAALGVTLQSQGFVTGVGTPGIVVQAPQFEGVENIVFPSFVMGVPITNVDQWNNTLYLSDTVSKVVGTHTLKFGGAVSRRSGQRKSERHVQRHLQHRRNRNRLTPSPTFCWVFPVTSRRPPASASICGIATARLSRRIAGGRGTI